MTAKFFAGIFILSVCLSACGVESLSNATQTATEIIESLPATEITSTPSPKPSSTLVELEWTPTINPNEIDGIVFPDLCLNRHGFTLSPDRKFIAISCGSKYDLTLNIFSQQGLVWTLKTTDYLSKSAVERGAPGGILARKWTPDSKYLYFASGISYSGDASCFYRDDDNVEGLFRLDVSNGIVSVVLPLVEDQIYMFSPYDISFSPTGRRLVYEGYEEPRIVDLQTGEETILEIPDGFASGSYIWAPNGSELAYSICDSMGLDGGGWIETESAIRIFSIFSRETRTILRADYKFMTIVSWNENNILEIESIDSKNHDYSIILIDMSTEQAVTPTP